jgi:hypothetical protein
LAGPGLLFSSKGGGPADGGSVRLCESLGSPKSKATCAGAEAWGTVLAGPGLLFLDKGGGPAA